MAVWFTGTDTGSKYVSGQLYANGNGVYRANSDGSFSNLSNGRVAVGSSQSDRVVFGNTGGSLGSSTRTSSTGAGVSRVSTGGPVGGGPGVPGVAPVAAGELGTGPGGRVVATTENRGAFLGAGSLARPAGMKPAKSSAGSQNWTAFGVEFQAFPGFSDGELIESRHGEGFLSDLWFLATIPADVAYTGGLWAKDQKFAPDAEAGHSMNYPWKAGKTEPWRPAGPTDLPPGDWGGPSPGVSYRTGF